MKPSKTSVLQVLTTAVPFAIVFPKFKKNAPLNFTSIQKSTAFMNVIQNSFNYAILGESGFNAVAKLIDNTQCHNLVYSDTNEVLSFFDELIS